MLSITYASIISFLSALMVAVLGHIFTIQRKRKDELSEMQMKACTDFIIASTRLASARRTGQTQDELNELSALNDAKVRICICGDKKVVEALKNFWEKGATLENEREILAFTTFCYRIRESLGRKAFDIKDLKISDTLFKIEPSNFSYRIANQHNHKDDN